MRGRSRFLLSVLLALPIIVCTAAPSAWAQCVPEPEMCDGLDNDCDEQIDEDVYGRFYSVFQQPSLTFGVTPIRSGGTAAAYYGYETLVPRSSNTPDQIEREDKLVLFVHEAPDGTTSLGLVFDQPIPEGGGGISTATGGHAELEIVDSALLPVVMDDASDTYGAAGGTLFEWEWLPGHTDGAVLARTDGRPFSCVTLSPISFAGVNGILIVDGATGNLISFDSVSNPITICTQLCCTPTNDGVEVCDGLDNDCDTEFDEEILPRPSTCGTGVCAATGEIVCVDGVDVDTCQPGSPTGDDDDCNGLDENCNETADENYQPTQTTCGVGACGNEGLLECVEGALVDTCAPLAPSDEVCDGVDNDCDGLTDEELGTLTCGTGACGNEVPACVDGQPQECVPLLPGDEICDGRDNDCDETVDEDTYGVWFNVTQAPFGDFAVLPVMGAGDAAAYYGYGTDVLRSSNTPDDIEREDTLVLYLYQGPDGAYSFGLVFDEPVPEGGGISTATGGSASLNILDADLSLVVQDDPDDVFLGAGGTYFEWSWTPGHTDGAVVTSSQGLPFCFTVAPVALEGIDHVAFFDGGTMRHIALDSTMAPITICAQLCCTPTNGGVEICDGVDNDCDYAIDEEIPAQPTTCGVGVCAATGELVCVDGQLVDTCEPGDPTGADDDCNGVDENCNETADENYAPTPTTCGVGACGNEGLLVCADGALVDTCVPLGAAPETCNAVDDDCDGLTDEDLVAEPTTCGTGACAATGALVCTDGQLVDTCTPGTPAVADATCDGVDEDCDGQTDEDYLATETTCGVGGCRATGTRACVDGVVVDSCVPGTPTAEVCDGVDNDCDRQTDEGFGNLTCGIGSCFVQVPACRNGQLQACVPGEPQPEICDGRDNDCDGEIDENTSGIFFSAFQQPSQIFPVTAIATPLSGVDYYGYGMGAALSSNTPDGLETEDALTLFVYDEPGDGYSFGLILDEPVIAGGGISQASGGRARVGVDGSYSVVVRDDDADVYPNGVNTTFEWRWGPGTTDGALLEVQNFDRAGCLTLSPMYFEKIYEINMFDAATGEHVYFDSLSNPITICSQLCCAPSGDEVCDGIDNDCDGLTDEDLDPRPVTCGTGACLREGYEACVDGQWVSDCVPGEPEGADDDCDLVDDDCDGETDEEYVPTDTYCGTGACAGTGELLCVDGVLVDTCVPGTATAELCNAIDDDCDGGTDEGFGTETCGSGACENTVNVCENGQLQQCVPLPGQPEICDGLDNDCDGEIDEGTDGVFFSVFQQPSQTFSVTAVTVPGMTAADYYNYDSAAAPRSADTPDDIEVEDALVLFIYRDELGQTALGAIFDTFAGGGGISDATGGSAQLTISDDVGALLVADDPSDALGTGVMGVNYAWQWNPGNTDGAVIAMDPFGCVTVTPRAFTGINRILFYSGASLQHVTFDSTSNPITICTQVCCTPTGPEECNGLDDDCDGQTDNLPAQPVECGEGACRRTGELVCMDGEWVDTCVPGEGTPEECNLVDDDCDGATDEDLPTTPTTCGEGGCAGEGELVCRDGEWVDTCEPTDPEPEICDGVDNDCDGETDEGFGTLTCGVGACYREVPECLDGVLQECVPGLPEEELCNGLDDDCDGETDEGAPEGAYYQVVQGAQAFPIQPVGGIESATEYYDYGGGLVPNSSATPDHIEKEDTLVLFVHEANGGAAVGAIFDLPIVVGGGMGQSDATGGSASLEVVARDAETLPLLLLDDPSDTFDQGSPFTNSASLLWMWNPGHTDGALFGPFEGFEWCLDIYPGAFQGVEAIEVVDGATTTHIPLASLTEMISICKVTCCVPSDEICDGMDNDCDELVDEDIPPNPITCGVGACERTGEERCEGGVFVPYCTPGDPLAEECNGIDDDCDGLTDEDLPVTEIECGIGECHRTGTRECIDGEWVETCVPGEPCAETCDGKDNDCDGETDEGLTVGTTHCGEGACENTGEYICVGGEWIDTCKPGMPGPAEICGDQIDNDCDGVAEEDCYCIQHGLVLSDEYTDANGAPAVWTYDEHERWTADIEDAVWIWDGYYVMDPESDETVSFTRTFFVPEEADAFGVPVGGILEIAADNSYTVTVNGALLADVADPENFSVADQYSLFGLLHPGANTIAFTVTNHGLPGAGPEDNPAGLLYRVELWFLAYPSEEVCDGIDNDCDGFIDEDMGELTCGVGACEVTVDACWHGVPQECVPGEPGEEICDGIDNDCDGLTDEDLVGDPVTCGEGACENTGRYECIDGQWVPFCTPLEPGVEVCNAIDDDCDGLTDEDLERYGYRASQGTTSYWIEPLATAETVVDFYQYGAPDASSANTDPAVEASNRATWFLYRSPDGHLSLVLLHDAPNDGSGGRVALSIAGLTAGVGVEVKDDPSHAPDTYDTATGLFTWQWNACCTDGAALGPMPTDLCVEITPSMMQGLAGIDVVTMGAMGLERLSFPALLEPVTICYEPMTTVCGEGACAAEGGYECIDGEWVDTCEPGVGMPEECNGIDDDCDGLVDEDLYGDETHCGVGACADHGQLVCVDGEWVDTCVPGDPQPEVCNGVDDDCDGLTDEDLYGDETRCGVGACAETGVLVCVDGEWVDTCEPGDPQPEECNGIDDDCDGLIDEELYGDATECGVGACADEGMWVCVNGEWVDTCEPGEPQPEICNNLDDDCDGETDEGLYQMGFKATQGDVSYWIDPVTGPEDVVGFYQYGAPDASSANTDPAVEASQRATWFLYRGPDGSLSLVLIHDAANDGSGGEVALNVAGLPGEAAVQVADDPTAQDARDTYDLGTGAFTWGWNECCTDGAAVGPLPEDLCVVITPELMRGLNGIDVLTQGLGGIERLSFPALDEPVEICAYPLVTTCGEGVCGGEGMLVCIEGEWVDTCQPGIGTEEVCDGVDNDCDGLTDEDLFGDETSCGEGACGATGQLVCVDGEWVDTCVPGDPQPEECNGIDDDCDGLTDEELYGDLTWCGVGACGATGEWVCVDGEWVDTCVPGDPLPEECNGIDDDCDGLTDEDLYGDATSCGVGACGATGEWVCVDGQWVDTCVPGDGTPEVCDGIDNDCDGLTDEDLTGEETACGQGACAATGRLVCENGTWVDTCVPGYPTDEECNLVDDDCDGATDEDLHGGPTTCGEPPCDGTGELLCIDGQWVDTCVPREGGPELCNELDDDCDGLTDEGCDFKLCEFVASASEPIPSPSFLAPLDSRAGSVEFNFNGAHGYDGVDTDFPWAAGFVTLRNGAGVQVEQIQVNRRWYPPLDEDGCTLGWEFPQCWIWPDGPELVEAFIPTYSDGSNTWFDNPGDRVEVSGGALLDYTVGELMDNSHETMIFTYTDPEGLDTAQLIFRGRYDWDLDGLDVDDVMIPLFRRNMSDPDFMAPFVAIVSETATEITLSVNVKEGLDFVRAHYDAMGFFD